MLQLLFALAVYAAMPAEETRLVAVADRVREEFAFATGEPRVTNPKIALPTAGHSPTEWFVNVLRKGDATVHFTDREGNVRRSVHYHVVKGELLEHFGFVKDLLKTARGVTVRVEDQKIVLDGTPGDWHAVNAARMVQAAYYDEVTNLACPSEDLCEKYKCERSAPPILLCTLEPFLDPMGNK
jgi:hypothetical protein